MMQRFCSFVALLVSLCLGITLCSAVPKNVLFISVDDMNTDLGCYGVSQVKTPHMDRLAAMGVRFDRAYCQQPLCGPSRASVMTGQRPTTTGFVRLRDDLRQLVPDVVTLGQFFQQQGYYVGRVGKVYHYNNPGSIGTNGHDDAATWQERYNPSGIDRLDEDQVIRYPGGTTGIRGGLGISMAWWDPESRDDEHTDGMVASQAIEMIRRNKDGPFFVAAGFFNPHCPYIAPKRYFDLYPLEEIELPDLEEAKRDLEDVPPMAIMRDSKGWPYYFDGVTREEARKCKQAYYACISFVDAQVGRLLDALEELKLMENTLIVFWSDHGYFIGEKGLWYKRKNFERSVRVPLIVAGPGIAAVGESCSSPVELLDLYPTIVDYAGFETPQALDGTSLRPLLSDPGMTWTRPAVSMVFHGPEAQGFSIRTGRWRYTEWNGGEAGKELYDHANDPEEVNNLAGDDRYALEQERLHRQLAPYAILQQ